MDQKKKNIPQKGAGRKWAAILKELGQKPPPKDLVDILNGTDKKKVAFPRDASKDLGDGLNLLKTTQDLSTYLEKFGSEPGCFADTSFLYALAYDDDRLHEKANEVLDVLADHAVSIYVNVITRMEFVDLIFRKQVTQGAIQLFQSLGPDSHNKPYFNLLKNIRDRDTTAKRINQSYKVDEGQLKRLRNEIEHASSTLKWRSFCKNHLGHVLMNEWSLLEDELGLKFVEVLEDEVSALIERPLRWTDMVQVMGEQGLRGPDAMIVNLFSKSKFPLLITGDKDFETCFADPLLIARDKSLLLLE